jgi:flagellar biosynthesis/type III secretory pathway chaperone
MISSSNATKTAAQIASAGDLARSLAEEAAELGGLLELLKQEQQALQARDIERVFSFAAAKTERLAALSAMDSARGKLLLAHGLPRDLAGMERFLAGASGRSAELTGVWRRLLADAAESRQINAVNGKLIAAQLRYVGGALAALQQTAAHLVCYGADGLTLSSPGARPRACA